MLLKLPHSMEWHGMGWRLAASLSWDRVLGVWHSVSAMGVGFDIHITLRYGHRIGMNEYTFLLFVLSSCTTVSISMRKSSAPKGKLISQRLGES